MIIKNLRNKENLVLGILMSRIIGIKRIESSGFGNHEFLGIKSQEVLTIEDNMHVFMAELFSKPCDGTGKNYASSVRHRAMVPRM